MYSTHIIFNPWVVHFLIFIVKYNLTFANKLMLYLYRIPLFQDVFECSFLSIFLPACLPCCSPIPLPSKVFCDSVISQLVLIRLRKAIQRPQSAKATTANHSQVKSLSTLILKA